MCQALYLIGSSQKPPEVNVSVPICIQETNLHTRKSSLGCLPQNLDSSYFTRNQGCRAVPDGESLGCLSQMQTPGPQHPGKHWSREYCPRLPEHLLRASPRLIPVTLRLEGWMSPFYVNGPERERDLIKATQRGRRAPTQILCLPLAAGASLLSPRRGERGEAGKGRGLGL